MKTHTWITPALAFTMFTTLTHGDALSDRVAALEDEVDQMRAEAALPDLANRVQLGGYGELHYNNLSGTGGADDKEELDFHRFVIYFGYEFNDRIRFASEIELEHALAGDDAPGEVEIEQAFIDFDLTDEQTARAGIFLVPVGLVNQTHEPTTFYGVERNPIETRIIPTTWWEGGAGAYGALGGGFRYDAYLHSGLRSSTNDAYAVRAGRQKVAKADASDPAGTVALNWDVPGMTLGGAVQYQSDVAGGNDPEAGEAWLGELHADVRRGPVRLRTVYAEWRLDGDGPESVGADRQYGWYVEPSIRPVEKVGAFIRYSAWDNLAGDAGLDSKKVQWDTGVNYWPHPQVVIKADYLWQDNENGADQSGFNLGLGYDF
jgi:hypothetical protein